MSASPLAVDITDILEYLICQKNKLFDILKWKKKLWSENFEYLHSCELKSKCFYFFLQYIHLFQNSKKEMSN